MNNTLLNVDDKTNVVIKSNGNVIFLQKDMVTGNSQIVVIADKDIEKLVKFLQENHLNKI